jgi:crossover junction endodeoxyribonuclease RusA
MALERDRPDDRRRPDFEFCVYGRPISARSRSRLLLAEWRRHVRAAVLARWSAGQLPYAVAVLRITHYAPKPVADMDNLIKPVRDALQSILYVDDRVVQDVTGNWRKLDIPFRLRTLSPTLADAFGDGRPFMHIRLWLAPEDEDLG